MMDPSEAATFSTSDEPSVSSVASEDHADAIQEPGPASMDARKPARFGRQVGEGSGLGLAPRTVEEAAQALEAVGRYCDSCPIRARCPEEVCAVWREEATALAILAGAEVPAAHGVPLRQIGR